MEMDVRSKSSKQDDDGNKQEYEVEEILDDTGSRKENRLQTIPGQVARLWTGAQLMGAHVRHGALCRACAGV